MKQIHYLKVIKIFLIAFLPFAAGLSNAQIGIGIANPVSSAQLDVTSTTRGFLPPRMTYLQRDAIDNPVSGLMIWCTNCGALGEVQVYNGAIWTNMTGGYAAAGRPSNIVIGYQEWMAQNLDVVTYRNGDTIPQVTDSAQWANLTSGAWCYYNNDPAKGAVYGKLYNRYAVTDPRGLAPAGWRIPSADEWHKLLIILGGTGTYPDRSLAGIKLRASILWDTPNKGINNEIGFTALPGGVRTLNGSFNSISSLASWWSSSEDGIGRLGGGYDNWYVAPKLNLDEFIDDAGLYYEHQPSQEGNPDPAPLERVPSERYGLSVRCIKADFSPSILIGTQTWMQRNLDVEKYRNGDIIPQITSQAQWDTTKTGAWCYYDNDPSNGLIYGKLYNWYAVKDPRGLAPEGWHIPADEEITLLGNFLGGTSLAGGKVKTPGAMYWNSPNTGATNSSGFSALPGGLRYYQFYGKGTAGQWWTTTPDTGPYPYRGGNYSVNNINTSLGIGESDPNAALSVRCIKDK